MRKYLWVVLFSFAMLTAARAEEVVDQSQPSEASPVAEAAAEVQSPELSSEPAVVSEVSSEPVLADIEADSTASTDDAAPTVVDDAVAATTTPTAPPVDVPADTAAENLEFVSGEVGSIDEAAKTVTIKLYGDTENAEEKTVTVHLDEATDITDGERDRELKSLVPGTEVDVEYDPASGKATYIFVY